MTQIAPTAQNIAAWINRDLSAGKVRVDQLEPQGVAAHFRCSPQVAAAAIQLVQAQAVATAEAVAQQTADFRAQASTRGAKANTGGAQLQMNTPAALQARVVDPRELLQQAGQALSRGDLNGEAAALAAYWNTYAGKEALSPADLMPAPGAEDALPPGSPQRGLLEAMRQAPQPVRLQMLRDFVTPKQAPSMGSSLSSLGAGLVDKLKQGLEQVKQNPGAAMMMMNPMLGLAMGAMHRPAATPNVTPQPPAGENGPGALPAGLSAQLAGIAQAAAAQHKAMNRYYPPDSVMSAFVHRFGAAAGGIDGVARDRLVTAFTAAVQRGDTKNLEALTARAEALSQDAYDASLKAALGE
ncbi:MAG: hypothetical protein IT381_08245 [Deltaproteobacteria bacterium]|nr:hypothetical protein [Deltaproteobacteria bacterium]